MSIGQTGKRAQQFASQHQRRHTIQYQSGASEPFIQRRTRTSAPADSYQHEPAPVDAVIQRASEDEHAEPDISNNTGTSAILNPNRGENNTQRIGRSSDSANVGGEKEKQLNPEVIADKVYEILLRENRDYIDRNGQRLGRL
ncbi:MAG: hypothetical protein CUN55_00785 [Phototrophicales bacterium]|nr:MAG: hypothetical protein CUN55_00785 [Phototrophicales bacterium]